MFHFTLPHWPQHQEARITTSIRPEDSANPRSRPFPVNLETRTPWRPADRPAESKAEDMPPRSMEPGVSPETHTPDERDRVNLAYGTTTSSTHADQHWTSDQDLLAVLALHDPGGNRLDDPYGLADLSPWETLGALSLGELSASQARSITRLSPREGLAAMGLVGS